MRVSTMSMHRQSVSSMMQAQNKVSRTMLQLSTQKRFLNPADDPIASSRINSLNANIQQLETYQSNAGIAENQLSLVESSLTSTSTILARVNELQKQGINGTYQQKDREVMAQEMDQLLQELQGIANTKDVNGEYIFAGFQSGTKPFTGQNGIFNYNGDSGNRAIQVSSSLSVQTSFSGYDVFASMPNGNGDFISNDGSVNNTGTGVISVGNVIDYNNYIADDYTISFVTNGSGDLAYQVIGTNSGQVVPALPATIPTDAPKYIAGGSIVFNGIEVSIDGEPAVGDDFGITPSISQDLFTTIQGIIDTLRMSTDTEVEKADFMNQMNRYASSLSQGYDHVLQVLTQVGANMATVDNETAVNGDLITHNQKTLSLIADIDPLEAISDLTLNMTALQTSQLTYSRMQDLTLFNYL